MTLNEVMTQTADAIREKTGKSEKIAPVNFAEEIKSISAGGGESEGSNWRYFDVSSIPAENRESMLYDLVLAGVLLIKAAMYDGTKVIVPSTMVIEWGVSELLSASYQLAWDENLTYTLMNGKLVTMGEILAEMGAMPEMLAQMGITEITEEQFYSLD